MNTRIGQLLARAVGEIASTGNFYQFLLALADAADAFTALRLQSGTVQLVNGVSPVIPLRVLQADGSIQCTLRTPTGAALTVHYAALASDRVLGTPGSFKISALDAADAVNAADGSVVDWIASGASF